MNKNNQRWAWKTIVLVFVVIDFVVRMKHRRVSVGSDWVIQSDNVEMDLMNCGSEWVERFLPSDVIINDKTNVFFFDNTFNNQ
jgi:hypothetical protein